MRYFKQMDMRKTDGNKQIAPAFHKQNNQEQSLIEIYYQHLSYSLKLAVKKCIIEILHTT